MSVKYGHGGLVKVEEHEGSKRDDQESTNCASNYHVRIQRNGHRVCICSCFAYLRDVDEIFDEYHWSRQSAAIANVLSLLW